MECRAGVAGGRCGETSFFAFTLHLAVGWVLAHPRLPKDSRLARHWNAFEIKLVDSFKCWRIFERTFLNEVP